MKTHAAADFGDKFQVLSRVVLCFNGLATGWDIKQKENLSFRPALSGGRVPYRYLHHGGV